MNEIKKYDEIKKEIVKRYNSRMAVCGAGYKSLAVGNMERQIIRYQVISEIGDLSNKKILDVGCGFGDYYGFLLAKGIKTKYVGIDINTKFIETAKEKYPTGQFEVVDFFSDEISEKYDYIVSSTAFNNKLNKICNYNFIKKIMSKMFDACDHGVSLNLMTSYVDYKLDHGFYYKPEKIFSLCKKITNKVTLRHDYCLYEFTIYLYK